MSDLAMMASTDEAIQKAEAEVMGAEGTAEENERLATSQDRSMIARWIVIGFMAVIAGLLAYVTLGVIGDYLNATGAVKWTEGAALIKDVLSSVLLPVVTLVIGFYFGVEKKA